MATINVTVTVKEKIVNATTSSQNMPSTEVARLVISTVAANPDALVGAPGASGTSGKSGYSGYSGVGLSGYSGFSGHYGQSGFSGFSGAQGPSGGDSGFSGFSGYSGPRGYSGQPGYAGASGESGASGKSGYSGMSGFSGMSGYSGFGGFSGVSGMSGYSGYSGKSFDTPLEASYVQYEHTNYADMSNVKNALDHLLYCPLDILTMNNNPVGFTTESSSMVLIEVGNVVNQINYVWSYTKPIENQELIFDYGKSNVYSSSLNTSLRSYQYTTMSGYSGFSGWSGFSGSPYTDYNTRLSATDEAAATAYKFSKIRFCHKRWWGFSTSESLADWTAVKTLENNELSIIRQQDRTMTAPNGGAYIYFVYHVGLGEATFYVNGNLDTNWNHQTVVYENDLGAVETFHVYRSQNSQTGSNIRIIIT